MKRSGFGILTALGFLLMALGLGSIKLAAGPLGILPYLSIGLGCGLLGHGIGGLMEGWAMARTPRLRQELRIARQDERNVMIANAAKGKAYDAMLYIFGALMLCFGLMDVGLEITLSLVGAYLLVVGVSVYYRSKYEKEM